LILIVIAVVNVKVRLAEAVRIYSMGGRAAT